MPVVILVVAKEPGIRHLLSAVLEDVGYNVFTAGNSGAALEIIDNHTLHLIVTDVQAPGVDRRDFFRMLVEDGLPVRVVVMASSNAAEIAQRVGAVGYLDKPFSVFQARATIMAAIQATGAAIPEIGLTEQERVLRVFVYTKHRFLGEMIELTLNHGVFVTRAEHDVIDAATIIRDWRPHLVVVDLDAAGSRLLHEMGLDRANGAMPIPIIGVTRNRSLGALLLAFEEGVDDVLTVPISPEELLARVLAITRRTYGQTFPVKPLLLIGA
ncbi:MAG TPA: response regulator, partial [Chloroflexota bacterium]|nr:response regulator [Chloroflexota bacterium]